jgi:DNA topoisomerase-1
VTCDLLVAAFPDLFDYTFTAKMEDQLDEIANGKAQRRATLEQFWTGLSSALAQAKESMPKVTIEREKPVPTGRACPECGGDLVERRGKRGRFVGCANYPKCTYVQRRSSQPTGQMCPRCGSALVLRTGRRGPFVGCSGYPTCTYTAKVSKEEPAVQA